MGITGYRKLAVAATLTIATSSLVRVSSSRLVTPPPLFSSLSRASNVLGR